MELFTPLLLLFMGIGVLAAIVGFLILVGMVLYGGWLLLVRAWHWIKPPKAKERNTEPIKLPADDLEWLRTTLAALDEEEVR